MYTATASPRAHRQQQYQPLRHIEGLTLRSALRSNPQASALAVAALLVPLGGALLGLSGLVLLGTLAGVSLAVPLVVIFSPVLVPAALGAALAVAGLVAAGALGVSGISTLVWIAGYVRRGGARGDTGAVAGMVVKPLDSGKRHVAEGAPPTFVGHRLRDSGDGLSSKAKDVASASKTCTARGRGK
ncbi:oleosin H2-like [Lolium perenne]|uniref:oleosin H2-like n=1 Tax=Lolium perenne TaxID=4522 RepID=UPI0021F5E60B|nr:oleosin H2-like [Lolium perenne]